MSKKICRTCLKRTYKTYKTHENIHYPGETEQLKISDMLRYLIPELYLGVTTNPEICEECKSTLRSAYAFRKKCLATENLIGAYLKKSRCNASSIELIDVLIFLEQQKHQKRSDRNKKEQQQYEISQVKAREIISEWDDDASQEPNDLKELSTRKEKLPNQTQVKKELTLSSELGVFVDKYGNCYNADGLSIAHPGAIRNAQTDFLQISEVFSLNEECNNKIRIYSDHSGEIKAKTYARKSPHITIIPEAKSTFTKPRISVIAEAKTDLLEPGVLQFREVKSYVRTPCIVNSQEGKSDSIATLEGATNAPLFSVLSETTSQISAPLASIVPMIKSESVEPLIPIIVDVRSESADTLSNITPDDPPENEDLLGDLERSDIKTEPLDHDDSPRDDDEETLTSSEANSNYDSIQGIIDNIPDTDNNFYVDIPEFVQINNFSLKDLDELRKKQLQIQKDNSTIARTVEEKPQSKVIDGLPGILHALKPLPSILPKPELKKPQNLDDQLVKIGQRLQRSKFTRRGTIYTSHPEVVETRNQSIYTTATTSRKGTIGKSFPEVLEAKNKVIYTTKTTSSTGQVNMSVRSTETKPTASSSTDVNEAVTQIVKRPSPKKCIVPRCPNSTELNPKKLFVWLPRKEDRRSQWFRAIGIQPMASFELYVCEDHFDLPNDMENWMHFKVFGSRMKMKEDALPHKYLRKPIPQELIYKSQLDDVDRKRRAEQLDRLEKMKVQRLDTLDDSARSEVDNTDISYKYSNSMDPLSMESSGSCPNLEGGNMADPELNQNELVFDEGSAGENCESMFTKDENLRARVMRTKRRKIKIVPVEDEITETVEAKKVPNKSDDVCVLFTNYTWDGLYVNDHDYLVTPYKRNKILINEDEQWLCMCFICGLKHPVDQHINHMNLHLSVCKLCKTNLGTPYMLNMHVRFHTKKCTSCTEKVIYGEMARHQMKHLEEDAEIEKTLEKKNHRKGKMMVADKNKKAVHFAMKMGSDSDRDEKTNSTRSEKLRTSNAKSSLCNKISTETAAIHMEPVVENLPNNTNYLSLKSESVQPYTERLTQFNDPDLVSKIAAQDKDSTPDDGELVLQNIKLELNESESVPELMEESSRKPTRRTTKRESLSPDVKNDRGRMRKRESTESEQMIKNSPRVLRSRTKKNYYETQEAANSFREVSSKKDYPH